MPAPPKPPRPTRKPAALDGLRPPTPTEAMPPIMRWLTGGAHLPEPQRAIFARFEILAHEMIRQCVPGAELSAGLRKLLEAKDCFVRASFE